MSESTSDDENLKFRFKCHADVSEMFSYRSSALLRVVQG